MKKFNKINVISELQIKKIIMFLCIVIILSCTQEGTKTQDESSDLNPFVGAWELVKWTVTAGDGTTQYPYGEGAQGLLIYTTSGQMSAQLMRPGIDFAQFKDFNGMVMIEKLIQTMFIAYWGTYMIDDTSKTINHQVHGSILSNWVGTMQVRNFLFENKDLLILTTKMEDAENVTGMNELIWKRIH